MPTPVATTLTQQQGQHQFQNGQVANQANE